MEEITKSKLNKIDDVVRVRRVKKVPSGKCRYRIVFGQKIMDAVGMSLGDKLSIKTDEEMILIQKTKGEGFTVSKYGGSSHGMIMFTTKNETIERLCHDHDPKMKEGQIFLTDNTMVG